MSNPWHAVPPDEVLRRLRSTPAGLTDAEAARRLARYGANLFRVARRVPVWVVFVAQFRSILVLLLATAMAIAVIAGDVLDAAAVGAVLVLNVVIGFVTELRARRAMESLLSLEVTRAHVLRDGAIRECDASALVPGDVIVLDAGQTVPADARLLASAELQTVEAPLTGESMAVDKRADARLAVDLPLSDRATMLYKTTAVVAGRARAVVVATGMTTEVGAIGVLAGGVATAPTPLERRLDQLGRRLAAVAVIVAACVAGLGALQDVPIGEIVQAALALAVAAVPEGLPVVGTIAMAVGVRRMARRHALVRRLPAVETLGSATVICTDKTGTLTAGEMVVTAIRLVEREIACPLVGGDEDERLMLLLRVGALANRSDGRRIGDPTEIALTRAARDAGLDPAALRDAWPEVGEIPFSSERLLMATFHRTPAGLVACVKGAPSRVIALSDHVLAAEGKRALRDGEREELLRLNLELAGRGLRVLALAIREAESVGEASLRGLTWIGLVGLSDPPAPGVAETIRVFRGAGIRTVMLTGDQRRTAEVVAHALGVLDAGAATLDGREVGHLSDSQLDDVVGQTAAFSRVSPEEKLRIVAALQRRGDIVAMLGDGVNDAAALRKANIGVAMGIRGTDLAKEAADVILQDDRFPTIAAAIEEGRVIFDNVRKFVFYLFSCNLAEILLLLGAGIAGLPAPLLPLQILWLNLLTDTFPALALAVEPSGPDIMRQPPRDPAAAILSRSMIRAIIGYAALIAGCSLAAYGWGLAGVAGKGSPGRAATLAFMTLALAQVFHLGNARSDRSVLAPREMLRNSYALAAVALAVGLQLLAAFLPPLAAVLQVEALSGTDWMLVAGLAVTPALVGQALKSA